MKPTSRSQLSYYILSTDTLPNGKQVVGQYPNSL
jgi:hypothetical protein